jgi:hypothetical protein
MQGSTGVPLTRQDGDGICPLVVHRSARVGREAREALLVDEPPAERAALCGGVQVVTVRVGERRLLDRPVAPALVHVGVRDRRINARVVLTVAVQVLVDLAAEPGEPARDAEPDAAVVSGVVHVDGLAGLDMNRFEPHDVAELLVPHGQVVVTRRDVLDVEVAGCVALIDENGLVSRGVRQRHERVLHRVGECAGRVRGPLHPVARGAGDLPGSGVRERPRRAHETEPVGGADGRGLPQLFARRTGPIGTLFGRRHQAQSAVDRRRLVPPAVRIAVARLVRRVHVDEVRRGTQVVDLNEAERRRGARRLADAAAKRVVVVVDRDGAPGLLLEPDLESAEARLFGVWSPVRPGVVVEGEDTDLPERQRIIRALRGQLHVDGDGPVGSRCIGQRQVVPPHLVVERTHRDQVSALRQRHGGVILVAFGNDRAIALRAERERVGRELRVVDVDDEVVASEGGFRAEVQPVDGDGATASRARRGRPGRGGGGRRHGYCRQGRSEQAQNRDSRGHRSAAPAIHAMASERMRSLHRPDSTGSPHRFLPRTGRLREGDVAISSRSLYSRSLAPGDGGSSARRPTAPRTPRRVRCRQRDHKEPPPGCIRS